MTFNTVIKVKFEGGLNKYFQMIADNRSIPGSISTVKCNESNIIIQRRNKQVFLCVPKLVIKVP